ncbi:hypothetical protein SNE40_022042 [Patella caerulea]|uniref:Uncharacterized protein n=1 Tax=Patella caerulea TaxID=87958 RepID=A0AAN8GD54_PATCE
MSDTGIETAQLVPKNNSNDNQDKTDQPMVPMEVVTSAENQDTGHPSVGNEQKPKKQRVMEKEKKLSKESVTESRDPPTKITSASTVDSWDTACSSAKKKSKQKTTLKPLPVACSTTTSTCPTPAVSDTGAEKRSSSTDDTKNKRKQSTKLSIPPTNLPTTGENGETSKGEIPKPAVFLLAEKEAESFSRALMQYAGPRDMTEVLSYHPCFDMSEWIPVFVTFVEVEDWHPHDTMQKLLGHVYWIPLVLRNVPWVTDILYDMFVLLNVLFLCMICLFY